MPILIDPILLRCPDVTQDICIPARDNLKHEQVDGALAADRPSNNYSHDRKQMITKRTSEMQRKPESYERWRRRERKSGGRKKGRKEEEQIQIFACSTPRHTQPAIPSAVAIRKLEKGHFVPLWYFTNKGIEAASRSFNDEAMVMVKKSDGTTLLVPTSSAMEEKGLIEDQDLTWEDFSIAVSRMTDAIGKAEWPQARILMMTAFWNGIQLHSSRSSSDPLGKRTLLLYQAEQRKLWHYAMQFPGHGYSLANNNEELLRQTKDRLFWIDQDLKEKEKDALVRGYILVFQKCKLTKVLFFDSKIDLCLLCSFLLFCRIRYDLEWMLIYAFLPSTV
jgi:hypothetical protein